MADQQIMDVEKEEATQLEDTERTRDRRVYVARADIYETDEAIVVLADVPGADENSVDITIEKNVLTIYAEVEPEQPGEHSLIYQEFDVGDYERSFVLSNQVDRSKIEATVKDGVLRLYLPKMPEAQARKISVRAG